MEMEEVVGRGLITLIRILVPDWLLRWVNTI